MRLLFVAVCVTASAAPAMGQDLAARLDSAVPVLMRVGDVPGLAAAVVRDGQVVWSGVFGVRDAGTRVPVDRNTVFTAASLTKGVVSYAVLRLADRGALDLDTPVVDEVPNADLAPDPRVQRITPRMLLTHSSGLPNGGRPLRLWFDPGTGWAYSGPGFAWLGHYVEKRTGLSLQEVVRREVFVPFGMTHSTMVFDDSLEADGASAHTEWGRPDPNTRPPADRIGAANAAGSLRTTAEDYAKFLIAIMDGRGLKPETFAALWTPQVETRNTPGFVDPSPTLRARIAWGLGWGLVRGDSGLLFWQWGDAGDAKAFVIGDPARHMAMVYFANAETGLSIAPHLVSLVAERAEYPHRLALRDMLDAEDALRRAGALPAADTVLAIAARDFPDSAAVPIARGDLWLTAGADVARAVTQYERAVALAPGDSVSRSRLAWARQDVDPAAHVRDVKRYVGVYSGGTFTRDGHHLYFQESGGRRLALVAVTNDTFEIEGNHGFRMQFVADSGTAVSKVMLAWYDGTRDEMRRSQ
jgi:CubicO group peptidase (beta-lactamase class C family)